MDVDEKLVEKAAEALHGTGLSPAMRGYFARAVLAAVLPDVRRALQPTVDRDALVRALFDASHPGERDPNDPNWHGNYYPDPLGAVDRFLASGVVQDAADVRRAVAEEVWDKGYAAGFSNAMRRMSDEPKAPTSPNPYRAAARDDDPQEARP